MAAAILALAAGLVMCSSTSYRPCCKTPPISCKVAPIANHMNAPRRGL
jgi:hypothetical protein